MLVADDVLWLVEDLSVGMGELPVTVAGLLE